MKAKTFLREKRMFGDYELLQDVQIGGKHFLLGCNGKDPFYPYMTCCQEVNFWGSFKISEVEAGRDYLEVLGVFLSQLQKQKKAIEQFRAQRKIPPELLDQRYCRRCGEDESLEGKLVILKPTSLAPEYRTADCQLGFAAGGLGCYPDSSGRSVDFIELYSGEQSKWDIDDILGLADLKKLPDWAKGKLAEYENKCAAPKKNRGERE